MDCGVQCHLDSIVFLLLLEMFKHHPALSLFLQHLCVSSPCVLQHLFFPSAIGSFFSFLRAQNFCLILPGFLGFFGDICGFGDYLYGLALPWISLGVFLVNPTACLGLDALNPVGKGGVEISFISPYLADCYEFTVIL